jgi:VIT1/CCC1 family predicted Fe2+/Mn2+ transporter
MNPWVQVEDYINRGFYELAGKALERLRPTVTDAEGLAYIDERLAHVAELQARSAARTASYLEKRRSRYEDRSPGKLTFALCAGLIGTTMLVVRFALHESPWLAVFVVTVLAALVVFLTGITVWTRLSEALPLAFHRVVAALSAGLFGYAAYRCGISTTLVCVGTFLVGLFVSTWPVHLVMTAWHRRGGRLDHL